MVRGAYLHFPFCKRKCLYCDFAVTAVGSSPQQSMFERYHQAIINVNLQTPFLIIGVIPKTKPKVA